MKLFCLYFFIFRKSTTDGSVSPSNSKKAASAAALNSAEEDECLCPICYSEYSSGGPHRLTSLKCGHLFGRSCVEQWICAGKNNTCPTCKAKTRLTDVRNIFATKIQVFFCVICEESEFVFPQAMFSLWF